MAPKPNVRPSISSAGQEHSPGGGHHRTNEIVGLKEVSEAVIYEHIFECADREVGGVLIGRAAAGGGLPLVTGAIPAISADEQRATLTFTQEAWAHFHRVLESEFPADEQIVGWYHSHPGFGIWLSGHDRFIHENFFTAPSQIAVVVDPHAQTEGVFAWRDGDLTPLFERPTPSGWVAARPAQRPASEVNASVSDHAAVDEPHDRYPLPVLAIAAIVGVVIGFGIWSLTEGNTSTSVSRQTKAAPEKVHVVKTTPVPESHIEVR